MSARMRRRVVALLLPLAALSACSPDSEGGDGAVGGAGTAPVQEDGAANETGGAEDQGS